MLLVFLLSLLFAPPPIPCHEGVLYITAETSATELTTQSPCGWLLILSDNTGRVWTVEASHPIYLGATRDAYCIVRRVNGEKSQDGYTAYLTFRTGRNASPMICKLKVLSRAPLWTDWNMRLSAEHE